jgi:superfamily II DNA or RNA helicase
VTGDYRTFLATKSQVVEPSGFEAGDLHPSLFPFQRDLVRWALRVGRGALFADTGLGKSRMQVEWARQVCAEAEGDVLILAPLAVAAQTAREGAAIGVDVQLCRDGDDVQPGVNVTNYDRLHRFDPGRFAGVVLDESSCIKHHDTRTLATLISAFRNTEYKLCATATPAPNDWAELGTHAEFLGVCSRQEMLAEFFVHDSSSKAAAAEWRLKGHAEGVFWRWVASWAALLRRPSDVGYEDGGYDLPPLEVEHVWVEGGAAPEGPLGLAERRAARKASMPERVRLCAELVNSDPSEQWLVWGQLNAETEALTRAIPGAVEVRGPDRPEAKEKALLDFADGRIRVLVTKPSIAGFGMNWQRCARMAFVGVDDSWESYYQAVRRCWRFGQARPVCVAVFASEAERAVVENLKRKEADARAMAEQLAAQTREAVRESIRRTARYNPYEPSRAIEFPAWLRSAA